MHKHPMIIQGGMGVAVSNWRLAQAVSRLGQLGVVSGTALDTIFARRLQDGDTGGHLRRAMERFPFRQMAERLWNKYFVPGGKQPGAPYKALPVLGKDGPRESRELCILANFVEVFLAREGHGNPVGINYLEKIQTPHLTSIYGAMLAGVGYVLMGAGIPMRIPAVLDKYVQHEPASYSLAVAGVQDGDDTVMTFDPREYAEVEVGPLSRPYFLPIISSNVLALTLARKANGRVDGFVIEGPSAGGHNAPPRGKLQVNEAGEPVYGERDRVDLAKMRELGLPFWLGGGYGRPGMLQAAIDEGAAGIQVGTAFAYCDESGLREEEKRRVLAMVRQGGGSVFTDRLISPSGFPFKVVRAPGTIAEKDLLEARARVCDLGYLREAYRTPEGKIAFRCPSEPVATYLAKGGKVEDTEGRGCICNALMATAGHPQVRADGTKELSVVTSGDDLESVLLYLGGGRQRYVAADVVRKLLEGVRA